MSNEEYRKTLQQLEQDSQRSYDKTLITLSSGAIVLSVTYLSRFNAPRWPSLLILAWIAWVLSLTVMLLSFLVSVHALRKGQDQVDATEKPTGGFWSKFVIPSNWAAGGLFLAGVVLMLFFVGVNRGG